MITNEHILNLENVVLYIKRLEDHLIFNKKSLKEMTLARDILAKENCKLRKKLNIDYEEIV